MEDKKTTTGRKTKMSSLPVDQPHFDQLEKYLKEHGGTKKDFIHTCIEQMATGTFSPAEQRAQEEEAVKQHIASLFAYHDETMALKDQIADLKADCATLKGTIATLESRLKAANQELARVKGALANRSLFKNRTIEVQTGF